MHPCAPTQNMIHPIARIRPHVPTCQLARPDAGLRLPRWQPPWLSHPLDSRRSHPLELASPACSGLSIGHRRKSWGSSLFGLPICKLTAPVSTTRRASASRGSIETRIWGLVVWLLFYLWQAPRVQIGWNPELSLLNSRFHPISSCSRRVRNVFMFLVGYDWENSTDHWNRNQRVVCGDIYSSTIVKFLHAISRPYCFNIWMQACAPCQKTQTTKMHSPATFRHMSIISITFIYNSSQNLIIAKKISHKSDII